MYVLELKQKVTLFMVIFVIGFFGFIHFGAGLLDQTDFIWQDILLVLFFLFLQITGVVFTALIPASALFLCIPIVIFVLGGLFLFNSFIVFAVPLGLPLIVVFFHIRHTLKNRIRIRFSEDIRRSVTLFFLLAFFFGSMLFAPIIQAYSTKIFHSLTDTVFSQNSHIIQKSQESLQNIYQRQADLVLPISTFRLPEQCCL